MEKEKLSKTEIETEDFHNRVSDAMKNVSKKKMVAGFKKSYSQDTDQPKKNMRKEKRGVIVTKQPKYAKYPVKKDVNNRKVNTSGSYDFKDRGSSVSPNTITVKKQKESGGVKLFDQNAASLFDEKKLKVDKKYQSKVNKVLGK
jgi:hypothetical protein